MKKEGCRLCHRYKTKECQGLVGKDGTKSDCKNFTGYYPNIRITPDKPAPLTIPTHKKYGLSVKILQELLIKQDNKCAICKQKKKLVLDHSHSDKKARGYLCSTCNTLLSGLDKPLWLKAANDYLNAPPAVAFYDDPTYESQIKFG